MYSYSKRRMRPEIALSISPWGFIENKENSGNLRAFADWDAYCHNGSGALSKSAP
jgi:hypothetical protein